MLFHEIFNSYYLAAASILKEAVRGNLTGKELNSLVQKHAFGESLLTIPDGLKGEKWRLLHKDFSTSLKEEPDMPLTRLEKRWMKALLLDPRIQLFNPDMSGLEDIAPLFTPDMVVYYDRYSDGDDYQNPEYILHFRTILQALREKRNLYIAKDDRFRLVAAGKKRRWVINLSRITVCEAACKDEPMKLQKAAAETVTFELEDRRNALERVLLHFSHLEKETRRLDERRYQVILRYDRQDETEMVIRILSFGSAIRVVEPDRMISLLRERINKQKMLNRTAG